MKMKKYNSKLDNFFKCRKATNSYEYLANPTLTVLWYQIDVKRDACVNQKSGIEQKFATFHQRYDIV